jgi:hypothetical protein
MSVSLYSQPFPECLPKNVTQYQANIFNGMMMIDVQVSAGRHREIKEAVHREKGQHMIKKRDTGRYVTAAATVEVYFDLDLGLFRGAGRFG